MATSRSGPALADAAHVLSGQLRTHLKRLSAALLPHAPRLERAFDSYLISQQFDRQQRRAMHRITLVNAARLLSAGRGVGDFFEDVEYHGRRLAKLNVPPGRVVQCVAEAGMLVQRALAGLPEAERRNHTWVSEQVNFAVILTLNNAYYQVREVETEAFYRLSQVELESRTLDELLGGFMAVLVRALGADSGVLYTLEEGEWHPRAKEPVTQGKRPLVAHNAQLLRKLSKPYQSQIARGAKYVLDPAWHKKYVYFWSVPIAEEGRTVGVVQLAFRRDWEWLPRELDLLLAAAERCLIASEKAKLVENLRRSEATIRELAAHMIDVEEAERRRISRELHDEAGQSMLCIRLALEMIEQALPDEMAGIRDRVSDTRDITEKTIIEVRRLIAALSPAVLEQLGLGAAIRQLSMRFRQIYPCTVRLHLVRLPEKLPRKIEIIVYRIVQECFNNIGKHSQAKSVNLSLSGSDTWLRLRVEDDGIGFDLSAAQAKHGSFGLAGMRERVTLLGGNCWIRSTPRGRNEKSGTEVLVEIPLGGEGITDTRSATKGKGPRGNERRER